MMKRGGELGAEVSIERVLRTLLWVGVGVLGLGFVWLAITRRLNFDEALALRAGWLMVQRIQAEPAFAMPIVYVLGLLGSAFEDPGAVFLIGRLLTVSSVLVALFWSLAVVKDRAVLGLAIVLSLTQATFVVHGLEFRYDWALLLGWLIGFRLVVEGRTKQFLWLGVVVSWLAVHHLKGLYLAAALVALAATRRSIELKSRLAQLAVGAGLGAGLWILASVVLGHFGTLQSMYATFLGLSRVADYKMGLWDALGETFMRDAGWWLGAIVVGLIALWEMARSREGWSEVGFYCLFFAVVPLGFLLLHPRPWPYMLALPAPFFSLLMASRLAGLRRAAGAAGTAIVVAAVLAVHGFAARSSPWSVYLESLEAPRSSQVETLRLLRSQSDPSDKVFDPTGMAYFLPPCSPDWYLDRLFQVRAFQGNWMRDLETARLDDCRWLVKSYRLGWLPPPIKSRFESDYVLIPGAGGLMLRVDDPALPTALSWATLDHEEIESFW